MSFISLFDLSHTPLDIHLYVNEKGNFSVWFYPTENEEDYNSVDIIHREVVELRGQKGIYL